MHLDHVFSDNAERIPWLEETGCTPVSWSFCKLVESVSDIKRCLENHAGVIRKLSDTRFPCYYLAGIHPRNLTKDLMPEHVRELILPYLDDAACLGVGEIGLETGNRQEVEILLAHLELAGDVAGRGKVFGIHTPRGNKAAVTRQTLDLLKSFTGFREKILIDHCTPETIGDVLSAGFQAGITVSPIKAAPEDVMNIVNDQGNFLSRIMLNTDSGSRFYEDLYQFVQTAELEMEIKTALVRSNAMRFFGIGVDE